MAGTETKTTTLRAYEDDVDRLDSHNRREETYAETFRRLLDKIEDSEQIEETDTNQ